MWSKGNNSNINNHEVLTAFWLIIATSIYDNVSSHKVKLIFLPLKLSIINSLSTLLLVPVIKSQDAIIFDERLPLWIWPQLTRLLLVNTIWWR